MNDASTNPPPSRGVSMTTLILTVALTAMTTVAVVLGVLYFVGANRPAGPGTSGSPSLLTALTGQAPTPFIQTDTVKTQNRLSGEIFYPIPYAAPPHLTLTAPHHIYSIAKQDEYGFSWMVESAADDFIEIVVDAAKGEKVKQPKEKVEYEDFAFEAKGIPAGPGVEFQRPVELPGSFQTVIGTQGQQNFEIPFTSPPQVTLSGSSSTTVIVETTNTGFKWKNDGKDDFRDNGEVRWTARGVRATKPSK